MFKKKGWRIGCGCLTTVIGLLIIIGIFAPKPSSPTRNAALVPIGTFAPTVITPTLQAQKAIIITPTSSIVLVATDTPFVAPTSTIAETPAAALVATDTPSVNPTPETKSVALVATDAPTPAQAAQTGATFLIIANQGKEEILGIRNDSSATIDIGGWWVNGSKGDERCVVPDGTQLPAGVVYQIATGDSQPSKPGFKCGDKPVWNNKGEDIYLHTASGVVLQAGGG